MECQLQRLFPSPVTLRSAGPPELQLDEHEASVRRYGQVNVAEKLHRQFNVSVGCQGDK